jgi:hypothetical protein
VSHLWNKSLTLQIEAQQLRATLHPSWLQRQAWGQRRADDAPKTPVPSIRIEAALAQPLPQALDALFNELQQQSDIGQASLTVTLSDAHVHFDVVAGDYVAYSAQQLQAIAQGCVAELLADAASTQVVRWNLQPDLRHLLICAVEQPLVDAVVQAADRYHLRLASLQPVFCQHWSHHSGALPQGNGVFTVADAGADAVAGHGLIACVLRGSITALSRCHWNLPGSGVPDMRAYMAALDLQVNRLLASLGQQALAMSRFVLVARDPRVLAPTERWSMCDWREDDT